MGLISFYKVQEVKNPSTTRKKKKNVMAASLLLGLHLPSHAATKMKTERKIQREGKNKLLYTRKTSYPYIDRGKKKQS